MKSGLLVCAYLSALSFSPAHASEHSECAIEFKLGSSVTLQNKNALDDCLNKLEQKQIDAITIVGSASSSGSLKQNKKLAHERALMIERIVKAKFSDASIKRINVGVNEEIGKKSVIHFVLKNENDEQKTAQASELQNKIDILQEKVADLQDDAKRKEQAVASAENAMQARELNEKAKKEEEENSFFNKNPNFRAALRLEADSTKKDSKRDFLAGGAEFSWLDHLSSFRPEFGVKASTSLNGIRIGDDKINNMTNVYGFMGIGGTAAGLVTGLRFLVGHEWIDIGDGLDKQDQFAFGGEARLGYELKRGMSVFASYGLTEHLQMIGVDVGVSL